MRKFLVLIFVLVFILSTTACQSNKPEFPESTDYSPGDKLHGFTLIEERNMVSPNALLRMWKHDKTGAQVYFFLNNDQDRTFSIAFRTEPSDDTGKLHILEHAVCAASEKYPGQDVFFDAISQAYITQMNATTYKSATNYFVSSMSENQLERMTDFYLDCSFNSALRTEPNYFYREGWRYSMPDAESPLVIDGIVYNEMKGSYGDIYSMHYSQSLSRALFPDTYQRWDSGGDPVTIPELTYEQLMAFYNECYHPSNSISMFYGDVETARYLKLMDEEYFSKFEAKSPAGYSSGQAAFAEMAIYEQDFPVSADSDQTKGIISYAVVLPEKMDYTEITALTTAIDCLGDKSSPIMEALYDSEIGAAYYAEYQSVGNQYMLIFTADEADTSRAHEFKTVVTESISAAIDNGLDFEMLDSIFAHKALNGALISNNAGIGVEMAHRLASAIDCGYMEALDYSSYIPAATELCKEGRLEPLMKKYIIDNTHAALVTTTPKLGLLEKKEAQLADALAAKKAAMSSEELEQIIADTAAFKKWNDESGSIPETLDKLRTETPSSVNTVMPVYQTNVVDIDNGAALYTADVEGDAVYCQYTFDVSHLSVEELRGLAVYLELLGLSTDERSQRDVSIATKSLFTEFQCSVEALRRADGSVYPALSFSFYALDDKVDEAAALIMEMLTHTDIGTNTQHFDTAINSKMQKYTIGENVFRSTAFYSALANSSPEAVLEDAIFGLDNYNYLKNLLEMDDSSLVEMFASIREKALVREGAIITVIGNAAGKKARTDALCSLLPASSEARNKGDWTNAFEKHQAKSIAFKSNSTASYAIAALDITSLGIEPSGDLQLLIDVMTDTFLLPEFRFQLGAYSSGMDISDTGIYQFQLFRAPTFKEPLARVPQLPNELEAILADMTPEDLAGYQLSCISDRTLPYGPWREAVNQLNYLKFYGIEPAKRQEILDQVCSATPERLAAVLPQLQQIIDASNYAVVAPGAKIDADPDMFEQIEQLP